MIEIQGNAHIEKAIDQADLHFFTSIVSVSCSFNLTDIFQSFLERPVFSQLLRFHERPTRPTF